MQKSDLQIEPYTINEALICINKELKLIKRKPVSLDRLRKLIYNIVKCDKIKVKGSYSKFDYNSLVDVYNYITTKHYPANRKSRTYKLAA